MAGKTETETFSDRPGEGERRAKTVSESRVEISQLMRPQQGNFAGNVHGGELLGLMDEAAYVCATQFAESYCVTVAVDHVEFRSAVEVGERVMLEAAVNAVGASSMQIGITVSAEDPQQPGSRRTANRSFFTMVAVDEQGGPRDVPRLELETPEDRREHCEAELQREIGRRFRQELEAGLCEFEAWDVDRPKPEDSGDDRDGPGQENSTTGVS